MEQLLTVREAAEILDVPTSKIIRSIRRNILPAQKKGWIWIIDRKDLLKVKDKIITKK